MPKRSAKRPQKARPKNYIAEWRSFRGDMTQAQLGDLIGVASATISRYETGEIAITIDVLVALAIALQTDHVSLLSVNPLDDQSIWPIWNAAQPEERSQIVKHAKAVIQKD